MLGNVFRDKVLTVKETKKEDTLRCSTNRKGVNSDMIISSCGKDYVIIAGPQRQVFRKIYLLDDWININVRTIFMRRLKMSVSVNETLATRKLQLALTVAGVGGSAGTTTTKSFSNINKNATAAQMYAAADALGSLMDNTVASIYYVDKALLQAESTEVQS